MCKKLIFVLAMLALVMPAAAFDPDHYEDDGSYDGDYTQLQIDIDAQGHTGPNETQAGWSAWQMPDYWSGFGAQSKVFSTASMGSVLVTMTPSSSFGGSRDRVDGATGDAQDFAQMLTDLVYLPRNISGMGREYVELKVRFNPIYAGYRLALTTFGWDTAFKGSGYGTGAGEPEDSKWIAWSETNPSTWLTDNGYDVNGYTWSPDVESNMPAGLMDLVEGYALQQGRGPWLTGLDASYGMLFGATSYVTLNSSGEAKIYGWVDEWSETGSHHLALSGIMINQPEPATIALLGLGGLALIRRKR